MPNYYDTLGISKEASEKDIRQAFRRLARQHHPDVNPDNPSAEDKFKEINEAYTVLNDPESRKKYDRYGDNWKYADQYEQAGPGSRRTYRRSSRGGGDPFGGSGAHSSIFDLFGGAGGGFAAASGPVSVLLPSSITLTFPWKRRSGAHPVCCSCKTDAGSRQ